MKIGIFSGSFNPMHIGHLILANYIVEFTDIEQVWLLVTPQNPFKENESLLAENIRFEMAQAALENYDKIIASDFEFSLPRPSYTFNTLEALSKAYPQHQFSLIIGADNWASFDKWHEAQKIRSNYDIYVYPRLGYNIEVDKLIESKIKILNSPIVEVSSTFIRNSIKEGKDIQAFVPESVYKFVKLHNLYSSFPK